MTWKVLYKISENINFIYIIKQEFVFMSSITGQTAGPIGLKKVQNLIFFKFFLRGQRRALQLV